MKSTHWRGIIAGAAVLAVLAWAFVEFEKSQVVQRENARIERIAAESLLAEKLSGPRYFSAPLSGISEEGGPWINVSDVRSQVERVAKERNLTPDKVRDLERLIDQMADLHPSRAIGGARISLNALNLALDRL